MNELINRALALGADEACLLPSSAIPINPDLAELCKSPRCADYGLAPGCPPHSFGPAGFRKQLEVYRQALVLRQWVPEQELTTDRGFAIMRQMQSLAARIELEALKLGWQQSRAYAGGSCKRLFCHDQPDCTILAGAGPCRFPNQARPSLSACGVDLLALLKVCGWSAHPSGAQQLTAKTRLSWVAAVVLLKTSSHLSRAEVVTTSTKAPALR